MSHSATFSYEAVSKDTIQLDEYIFEVDWNELDPPQGHPDAKEIPDDVVWANACKLLGVPAGSFD